MAAEKDTIARMKDYLQTRMKVLDENREHRTTNEDVRLENTEAQLSLNWKQDADGKNDEEEDVYLYLSSAARDTSQWPSPGQYQVILESEIDNVIKANLIQASFPLTDNTVNSNNNKIRYSLAPFAAIKTVTIPTGSYKGDQLALEIMIQLNQDLHAGLIPATNTVDFATGFLVDGAGAPAPGLEQFRVEFDAARNMFRFQLVDDAQLPVATQFALHVQPLPAADPQKPWSYFNDDLYSLLGFDRAAVARLGTFQPASNTYLLVNTTDYGAAFGPGAATDQRYSNGLHGDKAADLRGHWVIVLDIDPLNENDIVFVDDGNNNRFNVGNCLGFVLAKDPANSSDNMLEVNSNTYPVVKYYRNGRSRVKRLTVTLRRPDGTIYDFNGNDHFMALRLTVKRTQPMKPIFAR